MPEVLEVLAPAKINLALHVTGQRPDGRHVLESLVTFTTGGDRLRLAPATRDEFEIDGPFAAALRGEERNLVLAARDLLRRLFPAQDCPPVRIVLEKNLPVAAGIGGGSSDAAAALKALAHLWRLPLQDKKLATEALALGADLPMCLAARPLLAGGIGEKIGRIAGLPAMHLVVINPGIPLATGEVFGLLAQKRNAGLPPLPAGATLRGWIDWLSRTRNDLEVPALRLAPEIGEVLHFLRRSGAAVARMSGSGASCYGIFKDEEGQRQAAAAGAREGWFVTAAETMGSAPDMEDRT